MAVSVLNIIPNTYVSALLQELKHTDQALGDS